MQGLAPTQEQTSDTGSETSISSGEQLEHEVNELMDEIFGNDEIDVRQTTVSDKSRYNRSVHIPFYYTVHTKYCILKNNL